MQSVNQKSNALQSILGFFLQSVHAPYKVIDTLAHLGISISTDAINMAIQSLSVESENTLHNLRQSLLASYAYDNFDVDLKSQVPTAEKSNNSLKHLTSGLLFPLVHGVTVDDLKCSKELWKKLELNPHVEEWNIPNTWRSMQCQNIWALRGKLTRLIILVITFDILMSYLQINILYLYPAISSHLDLVRTHPSFVITRSNTAREF